MPIDFTSCLYLGLTHPSRELGGYPRLSSGRPAVLEREPDNARAEATLARLVGSEDAVLGSSTLHLFTDLFSLLAPTIDRILIDEELYPVARWAVNVVTPFGVKIEQFEHRNWDVLLQRLVARKLRTAVLLDDYCPGCGPDPRPRWRELLAALRRQPGVLVVDVTQTLGILGRPRSETAYGEGGGSATRQYGLFDGPTVAIASLAKGFGAPLAVAATCKGLARRMRTSGSQVHSSPPAVPVVLGALNALEQNRAMGEILRSRLERRARFFNQQLRSAGIRIAPHAMPFQVVPLSRESELQQVWEFLLACGIQSVPLRRHATAPPALAFALNVRHSRRELSQAVEGVRRAYTTAHSSGRAIGLRGAPAFDVLASSRSWERC